MKEKIKTTSFWLGVSGSLVIVADCISEIFGIAMFSDTVETVVITICSVLVLLGIITKKNVSDKEDISQDELLYELKNSDDNQDEDK